MSSLHDITFTTIDGEQARLGDYAGHAVLVVNVASECGLTPQYEGLQELADDYRDRGFFVLGFPCNQFMGQEPGDEDAIKKFTSEKYGISFPLAAKVDVNGPDRHPLYAELTAVADADGEAGDVQWNFEKFLLSPSGEVVGRFRPKVEPGAPELTEAIEDVLPV
ncbi:glutathione peroxidase [Dietzia natronolimnaea]|uniref:Glutathione peroxidase n=1 Tax=Dietzia natronolimnaea TaxID=161920 RepID=A0A2A2WLL4_9ACTN|nr:glutathione peroxidase [Dietzia natronolimnaea]PAY22087.1 glutathione peroxidase [Dietzia natronolimnaea]